MRYHHLAQAACAGIFSLFFSGCAIYYNPTEVGNTLEKKVDKILLETTTYSSSYSVAVSGARQSYASNQNGFMEVIRGWDRERARMNEWSKRFNEINERARRERKSQERYLEGQREIAREYYSKLQRDSELYRQQLERNRRY